MASKKQLAEMFFLLFNRRHKITRCRLNFISKSIPLYPSLSLDVKIYHIQHLTSQLSTSLPHKTLTNPQSYLLHIQILMCNTVVFIYCVPRTLHVGKLS
jgi:hypothetical protein